MSSKKKILIFNGYYYPSKNCGGPMTSVENIVNACCDDFDFYIICYNHDFADMTPFDVETRKWKTIGNANVMHVEQGFLDFSFKNMRFLFDSMKPDLVWFSGVLTPNNKIVSAILGRKMNIPVLFSPRGEVSADRVCIKKYKKLPFLFLYGKMGLYKNCYFHGTSDDEMEGLVKYFNPKADHLFRVANIAIMQQPDVIPLKKERGMLRAMFFSRIHEVKNLLYAVKCVCNCKQNIIYDVYGPIESRDYWEECQKTASEGPQNVELNYRGILSKEQLSKAIQEHDCFLFPTINENYGHVIAESLANSRPVLLSRGTTPWDDLDGRAGYAIPLDNPELFTEKLDYLASLDNDEYSNLIKRTKQYFNEKVTADGAVEGHKKMLNDIISQYE